MGSGNHRLTARLILTAGLALALVGCERQLNLPAAVSLPQASPPTSTTPVTSPWPSVPALASYAFDGRDFQLGRVLATTAAYTRYFVTYRSGPLTISGIMNVPHGDGPFPVLILNHGYIDPAVYTNGRGLRREQDYLASHGYAVLHPDYRNHAQSDRTEDANLSLRLDYAVDVANAVYALRASGLPQLDTDRIGMLGHFMGGGVTTNLVVAVPGLVKAAVLFAPVSADAAANFERWVRRRPEVSQTIIERYGAPTSSPAFWRDLSAINFTERVAVPVLIHHGTADESVPLEWSRQLEASLRGHGKDVTLHEYPGQPHEFTSAWPQVMQRTLDFFNRHVAES